MTWTPLISSPVEQKLRGRMTVGRGYFPGVLADTERVTYLREDRPALVIGNVATKSPLAGPAGRP